MTLSLSVSLAALALGSFWWIWLRPGKLVVSAPRSSASVSHASTLRIRFPLVLNNVGARPVVVDALRILVDGHELEAGTTRKTLRPREDDFADLAVPFAVAAGAARELIVEFGDGRTTWRPKPGRVYSFTLERLSGGHWRDVVMFDWHAPSHDVGRYIAHRNCADVADTPPGVDAPAANY